MTEAIIAALITGVCAIIAQAVIAARNAKDLYARLDKQSELNDAEIKGQIEVIRTEISELRKQTEKHNSVLERTYNLEVEVARHGEQIKTLFNNTAK